MGRMRRKYDTTHLLKRASVFLPMALVHRWHHTLSSNHLPSVMRPILLPSTSVNQRLPSGPAVIPSGVLLPFERGNSLMVPPGLMRPILLPSISVNQRLPSGPAVIPSGLLPAVEVANSVMFFV